MTVEVPAGARLREPGRRGGVLHLPRVYDMRHRKAHLGALGIKVLVHPAVTLVAEHEGARLALTALRGGVTTLHDPVDVDRDQSCDRLAGRRSSCRALWDASSGACRMTAVNVTDFDRATVDGLLSTTRSVRRRLGLGARGVERGVVEECLQLALQAPTGSNGQTWRWVIVDDAAKRSGTRRCLCAELDVVSAAAE